MMLDKQSEELKEHIDKTVEPLLVQVKKTNGRLSWVEKMVWIATGSLIILVPLTNVLWNDVRALWDERTSVEDIQNIVDKTLDERMEIVP